MKPFILFISFLFVATGISYAQSNVTDTHPEASIYVIDQSTGQKIPVNYDTANLFKDAFVDLVLNTDIAQRESSRRFPGEKSLVVEQLDPQTNGNAYRLQLQSRDRNYNMTFTIYTFVYNIDQNALTFLDQRYQRYIPVEIQGPNLNNLNNCYSYAGFNAQYQTGSDAQTIDTPIDADVSASVAPPEMPDYQQPECPTDGYLWQPGYWGYNPRMNVYYWVPGAWVAPPNNGVVWTPPYWGYEGNIYVFHSGYWGEHVGFYGGINYGYGYGGHGFYGGEWRDNHFHYNTAVTHVNVTVVHNTYINTTVINNTTIINNNHSSFNGAGGVAAKPTQVEIEAVHEHHEMPTPEQNRNQQLARVDKNQFVAPGSNAKPASVAIERVPVKPAINNQQRPGAQGNPANNNARPGVNQPVNQNNGRIGVAEPANNNATKPAATQPANPNNGGRTGNGFEPAANGATKPAMSEPANPNGAKVGTTEPVNNNNATKPAMTEPANPNGGRVGTAEPANNSATRPAMTEPANPNGGRSGGVNPNTNNGGTRPAVNAQPNQPAANPGTPASNRPANTDNQNQVKPAPASTGANAITPNNGQKPAGNVQGKNNQIKHKPLPVAPKPQN
jgi:hypothetical protein